MQSIKHTRKYLNRKLLTLSVALAIIAALMAGGVVTAVNFTQTDKSVEGARATTSDITTVTVTHQGVTIATSAEAAAADDPIAGSATDATTVKRAATVTAGHYVYRIKFESTATDDDIPAGKLSLRWTVGGAEQTAAPTVSAVVVGVGVKGGFTLLIPGDVDDTPEDIQLVYAAD